ncbi:hypothetical protein CMO94_00985 [Candidatus Woesearchaeota archaeon]|nr:hypothetical protein [Candidatus Woesearchaeota archaeon]
MKKRGQITIFLILGVVIIVVFVMFYYLNSLSRINPGENIVSKSEAGDIVKKYAESCLKMVSDEALFEMIGLQGGYIGSVPNPASYHGNDVPIYLVATCIDYCSQWVDPPSPEASCLAAAGATPPSCDPVCECLEWRCKWTYTMNIPDNDWVGPNDNGYIYADCEDGVIDSMVNGNWVSYNYKTGFPPPGGEDFSVISDKLAAHITANTDNKFEECFEMDVFENIGIGVEDAGGGIENVDVSINEEDVTIQLTYPLDITADDTITKIDSFRVKLPIRLKFLYESAIELVNHIQANAEQDTVLTVATSSEVAASSNLEKIPYRIVGYCRSSFNDVKDLTNIYIRDADDTPPLLNNILQFNDFSTFYEHYVKSYIFQFAVKGVKITNQCS